MLVLDNIWKNKSVNRSTTSILSGITAKIQTNDRLAVLGTVGSGKSTLMRVLCGFERPDHGRLVSTVHTSFPIGRPIPLMARHSLSRNCAYLARIHCLDPADLIRFVSNVGRLHKYMDIPVAKVSPGIVSRFTYCLGYGLPFDFFLIYGHPLPRGGEVPPELERLATERMTTKGYILATNSMRLAGAYCDRFAVLSHGRLEFYDDQDAAAETLKRLQNGAALPVAENRLTEARRALSRRDMNKLAAIAETESETNGETSFALWMLGELSLASGNDKAAAGYILEACETLPVVDEAWAALAKLVQAAKSYAEAQAYASALLQCDNDRLRRFAEAILRRQKETSRDDGAALRDRATDAAARSSASDVNFSSILKIGSAQTDSARSLADAKAALAAGDYERVAALSSECSEGDALWLRAEIALRCGAREEAAARIMDICRQHPAIDAAWASLVKLLETEADRDEAERFAMLLLSHGSANFRRIAARALERHGDKASALLAWREVMAARPDNPGVLLEIAEIEIARGDAAVGLDILRPLVGDDCRSWRLLQAKARAESSLGHMDDLAETLSRLSMVRPELTQRMLRTLPSEMRTEIQRLSEQRLPG